MDDQREEIKTTRTLLLFYKIYQNLFFEGKVGATDGTWFQALWYKRWTILRCRINCGSDGKGVLGIARQDNKDFHRIFTLP